MKERNIDKHGLAINIMKFQYFNFEFFNCQEIVLYETLMVLGGKSFAKREEFFHSTQTLADKTGIKRHSVDRILIKFKKMGIIDYQIKGMPKVKHIRILWDNILEMLPEIYQFNKVKEYFGGSTQPLIDFYKQLAEKDEKIPENIEEKNIIKNNTEEHDKKIKKEIQENAIAEDEENAVNNFNLFLDKLFQYKETPRKEFKVKDIIQALKYYDIKEVKEYVEYRYNNIGTFDMRKFFKFSESGRMTDLEEYFRLQEKGSEVFIDSLTDKFQDRIKYFNENSNKTKNYTPLPVKKSVIPKMSKVLKVKGRIDVINAFVAFADDILEGQINPNLDALSYFLKEENGEYPVIDRYQLKYIKEYSSHY